MQDVDSPAEEKGSSISLFPAALGPVREQGVKGDTTAGPSRTFREKQQMGPGEPTSPTAVVPSHASQSHGAPTFVLRQILSFTPYP